MDYTMKFGVLSDVARSQKLEPGTKFRIALLGDFSARANSGHLDVGDELAQHKPLRVDVDNIDDVISRLDITLHLPIGDDEHAVDVSIGSMDDFHPDELYENLEVFEELSGLRQRLESSSMFSAAADEVQEWLGEEAIAKHRRPKSRPRSTSIPVGGKLSDFAQLVGRPTSSVGEESDAEELVKCVVAPYVVPADDPDQDAMVAAVDEAISGLMRDVLHHPDFQTLESLWRSVDLLTRSLETGPGLQIVLYDITAEELAADLSATDDLEETGLYKLLIEQAAMDASQGALSVLVGNYVFEQTPPHAELLGRMAKIAAVAGAPFLASLGPEAIKKVNPDDVHPLVRDSWNALRSLPEAVYLGLAVPRFLLRQPYGAKSDPIDEFEFEEFTPNSGLRGMLWGNSAVLAGLLLGQTCSQQGLKSMELGSIMSLGDMPYYVFNDADGDQVALPCTERMISVRDAEWVVSQRLMPVLSIRGTPEVRLASFQSVTGQLLAGPWAPAGDVASAASAPPAVAGAVAETATEPETSPTSEDETSDAPPADDTTAPSEDGGSDDELDALLAGLGDDDGDSGGGDADSSADEDMDPDLAALLADL